MTAVKTAPFIATGSNLQQTVEWFFTSTIALANLLLPLAGVQISTDKVAVEKVTAVEPDSKP